MLIYNTAAHFTKTFKPGPICLKAFSGTKPPPRTENLMRAIMNYARFKGMSFIPRETMERLQTDPYFKYAFAPLVTNYWSFFLNEPHTFYPKDELPMAQQRLVELLQHPERLTDKDLYWGLGNWMNNFPESMPGGSWNHCCHDTIRQFSYDSRSRQLAVFLDAIDTVLINRELLGKVGMLRFDYERGYKHPFSEDRFALCVPYLKLCIDVFNAMMEEYGYTAKHLMG